jgi:hypothetical protein
MDAALFDDASERSRTRGGQTQRGEAVVGESSSSRGKVRAYRERLRARGLRPVTMWLPDVDSPEFIERAHLDSLAIANSPTEAEDQAFVDAISEDDKGE